MRVSISHEEKVNSSGIIFKKHTTKYLVKCNVELSEEERQVLDKRKLWDHEVFSFNVPVAGEEVKQSVTVRKLFTNYVRAFDTPGEAKNFEGELKNIYLPAIKNVIANNASPGGSTTFEL